jgi:hypothetical protein
MGMTDDKDHDAGRKVVGAVMTESLAAPSNGRPFCETPNNLVGSTPQVFIYWVKMLNNIVAPTRSLGPEADRTSRGRRCGPPF